ncbi:UMP kinase [Candidatus Pacearchaeota archaeon]|nr:UMP kinase [Candidatus Pacearchaeota archaeon]
MFIISDYGRIYKIGLLNIAMKKDVIVISLGGSMIFKNNEINIKFLRNFKKLILKHSKKHKFIIVCGGGSVARMYIGGLKKQGMSEKLQSFAGISVTRTNARFMSYFFGNDQMEGIPSTINGVKEMIKKQDIVFCGALEYHPNQTSDTTSAQIAEEFEADFINITNVSGLHDKNPLEHKDAKFIPQITWGNFYKVALKMKFSPGQHFVLDQKAAKIIMDNKITTYIVGSNINNLDNLLNSRRFTGTIIEG